jgi:hypothetical protein
MRKIRTLPTGTNSSGSIISLGPCLIWKVKKFADLRFFDVLKYYQLLIGLLTGIYSPSEINLRIFSVRAINSGLFRICSISKSENFAFFASSHSVNARELTRNPHAKCATPSALSTAILRCGGTAFRLVGGKSTLTPIKSVTIRTIKITNIMCNTTLQ